ncbi:MAG: hypothetical protein ACOCWQ_00280 [Nanoarchaeota archaeon]
MVSDKVFFSLTGTVAAVAVTVLGVQMWRYAPFDRPDPDPVPLVRTLPQEKAYAPARVQKSPSVSQPDPVRETLPFADGGGSWPYPDYSYEKEGVRTCFGFFPYGSRIESPLLYAIVAPEGLLSFDFVDKGEYAVTTGSHCMLTFDDAQSSLGLIVNGRRFKDLDSLDRKLEIKVPLSFGKNYVQPIMYTEDSWRMAAESMVVYRMRAPSCIEDAIRSAPGAQKVLDDNPYRQVLQDAFFPSTGYVADVESEGL